MKIYVFCVAVRNRKGGELCVWVQVPGQMHQGAGEGGRRHGTCGGVSTILSSVYRLLFIIGVLFL